MYNLAIRKCTSPLLLAPRLKIYYPAGNRTRTGWTRGRHTTIWANAASCNSILCTCDKVLLSKHKKGMFKAKSLWSKRGVPATSNRCPDQLSRQFLTTASTFPHSSKKSSAKHIHALSTCLTFINTLAHTLIYTDKHTHKHTHKHTLTHTGTCITKVWICLAEEFLELHVKVEAVVRNRLLR